VELELLLVRSTGWIAAVLLLLAVAWTGRWRRRFGLASWGAALVHFGATQATPLLPELALVIYEPHLRAGATALVVLTFLGATSFPTLVDRLRIRQWKALHRAVYFALLLVLHHALLSPHLPRFGAIALATAVILLIARRLSPW
jgi:sulfoxide reductase heme-binding subunit YedZ